MADIFEKRRLSPRQLREVSEKRFGDAVCLRESESNARANGVFYLGGFVIECLLKARLLEQYPSMQKISSTVGLSFADRDLWFLIYRSHDLDEMLGYLRDMERRLSVADRAEGTNRLRKLRTICASWSIFARYSPMSETMKNAGAFLNDVRELRSWLR